MYRWERGRPARSFLIIEIAASHNAWGPGPRSQGN